jgi:ABC-type glutathione transport system ATPase component
MIGQPKRVTIASGDRTIAAIDDFSFVPNEITFLFGESGIGKSMLCKAIYGLLDPTELDITVGGMSYQRYLDLKETENISRSGFFVFQEPSSHLNPLMRIGAQLREGSIDGTEDEEEILARLWENSDTRKVGEILDVYPKPYRPSGGEKQRILLAMAFKKIRRMAVHPCDASTLFVFDEPTGSLDNRYRNRFLAFLFEEYMLRQFTALVITHDYSIISEIYAKDNGLADRIHFRELRHKGEGRVELVEFNADDYLTWLRSISGKKNLTKIGEPVLYFSSRFTIFGQEHRICRDEEHAQETDLLIHAGEIVYVKAPSGTGKTTLAKIVMGLHEAEKFSMTLVGASISQVTPRSFFEREVWGRRAGMVFQHADEALDLEVTVTETFAGLPLGRAFSHAELIRFLGELFEGKLDETFMSRKIKFLSGGQKQRLNLLRTIIMHPPLLILDEPLNGLDFDSARKIIAMLDEMRKQGNALLLISHNEEIFDALVEKECVYYLT